MLYRNSERNNKIKIKINKIGIYEHIDVDKCSCKT